MIDKQYGKFYTTCDGCGDELAPTDTFDEARDQLELEGWETKRIESDWANLCPSCAKEV